MSGSQQHRMCALVIGLGSIGRRHATNLCALGRPIDLVLLRREGRIDTTSHELGARVVPDLSAALEARPDFAVLATPSARHADMLLPLLEAGIPCYVEKPVVSRCNDLERLTATLSHLRSIPVTHAGYNLRYLPSLLRLHGLVADGAVGNVVRASLQAGQWLPDWRPEQDYRTSYSANQSEGGGVILDLMHEIDAARWLFGEFDQVIAMAGKYSGLEIASEDTACMVLRGQQGGPLVTVSLDYVSRHRVRRYEIVGEKGTLIWDLASARLDIITRGGVKAVECGGSDFDMNQTYVAAMKEFVDSVEDGCTTSQDIFEGMRSVNLAFRVRMAAGL